MWARFGRRVKLRLSDGFDACDVQRHLHAPEGT